MKILPLIVACVLTVGCQDEAAKQCDDAHFKSVYSVLQGDLQADELEHASHVISEAQGVRLLGLRSINGELVWIALAEKPAPVLLALKSAGNARFSPLTINAVLADRLLRDEELRAVRSQFFNDQGSYRFRPVTCE